MKDIRSIDIDAADLVRNLGRLGALRAKALPNKEEMLGFPLPQNAVRALWSESAGLISDLPSILLSSEGVLGDLLPRMLALPGVATPITSLMKTWVIEDFRDNRANGEHSLSDVETLGFVGLIVGELKTTIGVNADLRLIGMDSVRRTLAFVCAQASMKGWRNGGLAKIVERWLEASTLTANEVDIKAISPIADICGFLQELSAFEEAADNIPQTLAYQIESWVDTQDGRNQPDLLPRSLTHYAGALMGARSREERFDAVTEALDQSQSTGGRLHPLEQGFLISLIEPGSFDFFDLAKRAEPNTGAVATAYCACAAILGNQTTLSKFNGFGWNVVNQGLRFGIELPTDISITELRILHDARRAAQIVFRTRSPLLVDVELAPMVTGTFGNVARRRISSQRVEEEAAATEREELLHGSITAALRALEDARGILQSRRPRQDRKSGAPRRPSKYE